MRTCLMSGQTFRYGPVDYQVWLMYKGKLSKLSKLDACFARSLNADFSLCLVSNPGHLFSACVGVQNKFA